MPSRRSMSRSWLAIPSASRPGSAMPARFFSGPIPPKRSAIMLRVPITCCRPRARRGFPPGSPCSISGNGPRSSSSERTSLPSSAPPRSRSAAPKGSRRTPGPSRSVSTGDEPGLKPPPPRRGNARRNLDRPLHARHRARACGRDLRFDRAEPVRAVRARRRSLCASPEHPGETAGVWRAPLRQRADRGAHALADPVPRDREGLFSHLRQLLSGHPHGDADSDRGDRHGPPWAAQRGLGIADGAPQGEDRNRFRHRAPPVHPGLRPALEGVIGMAAAGRALKPHAVLFVCGLNAIRSPMAAALFRQWFGRSAYVGSAGVRKGELDPFAVAVMDEIGLDIHKHRPMTFEELEEWEGLNFDVIVTLAPERHHQALELTRSLPVEVEYWPTPDPSVGSGSREQRLQAYREV